MKFACGSGMCFGTSSSVATSYCYVLGLSSLSLGCVLFGVLGFSLGWFVASALDVGFSHLVFLVLTLLILTNHYGGPVPGMWAGLFVFFLRIFGF